MSFAVDSNENGVSPVALVDRHCRPAAVCWPAIVAAFLALPAGVVAVVVDAVDRKPIWFTAHVSKKVIELLPVSTDFDSAFSVVRKCLMAGVEASGNHTMPAAICGFRLPVVQMAVFGQSGRANLDFEAPARLCLTAFEPAPGGGGLLATFAGANPLRPLPRASSPFDYCQVSKLTSGQINESHTEVLSLVNVYVVIIRENIDGSHKKATKNLLGIALMLAAEVKRLRGA